MHTVAGRLPLSAERPTHPKGLDSPSLFAKRPTRLTVPGPVVWDPVVPRTGFRDAGKLHPRGPRQEIRSKWMLRACMPSGADSGASGDASNRLGQAIRRTARSRRRRFGPRNGALRDPLVGIRAFALSAQTETRPSHRGVHPQHHSAAQRHRRARHHVVTAPLAGTSKQFRRLARPCPRPGRDRSLFAARDLYCRKHQVQADRRFARGAPCARPQGSTAVHSSSPHPIPQHVAGVRGRLACRSLGPALRPASSRLSGDSAILGLGKTNPSGCQGVSGGASHG